MLSVEQTIELECRIAEEIEALRAEMEASSEEREAVSPDKAIGRLSRLDSMQMQEMAKDAHRRREERLDLLEFALDRIETGEYGSCRRCGKAVPWERLEAQPEAEHCAACASQATAG